MRLTEKYDPKIPVHKEWLALLKEFATLLKEYNQPPQEAAFWYGERALTGLLAAAAWRIPKGWSLEEFTGVRQTGKKSTTGRGDLWFGLGDKVFTVEAKLVWPAGGIDAALAMTSRGLYEARTQLRELGKEYREGIPTSVCYVVPRPLQSGPYGTVARVEEFFTKVPGCLAKPRTVVGTFFYEKNAPKYDGRLYPGVIVVARFWAKW